MADVATARDRIAFLRGLRAVRNFRPDPLPQAAIDDLLAVARWSGSASNRQPWEIVVVRDRDTLQKLAATEGHAAHLAGAALGIVIVLDNERPEQEAYDDGRLSERLMLAAEAYGVGSCIGWFTGDGREAVKDLLGIPRDRLVRTAISFGYPDETARRARPRNAQPRKPLGEIVHFERY
ncbi:MAG TPA: nitroreductase family protein [Thermomicrobiales bacterium]|nr:nitroreductase family protein [Thermomicrobiales bacterium]